MVTDFESDATDGNGINRPVRFFRYTKKFEDECGYYLFIGMSYSDYWDGDAEMVKYYRNKDEREKERQNYYLWLQGRYFYEAILDASPSLNPFSKRKKPFDYIDKPIPITSRAKEVVEKTNEYEKMVDTKNALQSWAESFNAKFKGELKNA